MERLFKVLPSIDVCEIELGMSDLTLNTHEEHEHVWADPGLHCGLFEVLAMLLRRVQNVLQP